MWSGGSTGAEATGDRVSSGTDNPIPGNWLPQGPTCGAAWVAGGEAMATGAGASGRTATGEGKGRFTEADVSQQLLRKMSLLLLMMLCMRVCVLGDCDWLYLFVC